MDDSSHENGVVIFKTCINLNKNQEDSLIDDRKGNKSYREEIVYD